ncbi:hypothetical protein U1Q18_047932, partial [Sarracenia purpurea var. burkii]
RRHQREVANRGQVRKLQALWPKDFIEVAEEGTSGREEENYPALPVLEDWVQRKLQWTIQKSRLRRNCRGDLGGISDLEDHWIGSVFPGNFRVICAHSDLAFGKGPAKIQGAYSELICLRGQLSDEGFSGAKRKKKGIAGVFLFLFAEEKNDRSKCGLVHTENSGDRQLRQAAASARGGFSAGVAGDLGGEEEAQRIGGEKQPELKAFPVKKRQTA